MFTGCLTVGTAGTEDNIVASIGNLAEENHDEGGGNHPVCIASIEKLPATCDGSPALARKHCKIRHGGEAANVRGKVIKPEKMAKRQLLPSARKNHSQCCTKDSTYPKLYLHRN